MNKIEDLETRIKAMAAELAELKKETVIEPVFPKYGPRHRGYSESDTAYKCGLTDYSVDGSSKIKAWLEARAFVIEAINQANKGNNGFKLGEPNNLITFNHDTGQFEQTHWGCLQGSEDCLYIRSIDIANNLLKCEKFQDAYKKMLGIES